MPRAHSPQAQENAPAQPRDCAAPTSGAASVDGARVQPLRLATLEAGRSSATVATEAIRLHLANAAMIVAFPGCTDLAPLARGGGSRRLANPNFQEDAVERIRALDDTLKSTGVPYVIIVSAAPRLRKLWKAPTAIISPHEYGGWLNRGEPHPCFPDVVPSQDAYKKRTFIYTGNGFILPHKRLVTPKWAKRRRKGNWCASRRFMHRKHKNLRRLSPLGFLSALCGHEFGCNVTFFKSANW